MVDKHFELAEKAISKMTKYDDYNIFGLSLGEESVLYIHPNRCCLHIYHDFANRDVWWLNKDKTWKNYSYRFRREELLEILESFKSKEEEW